MAIAVTHYGTLTATTGEQTLGAEETTANTYVCMVDLLNMAAGDVVLIRAKVKTLTGSTAAVYFKATYANAQVAKVVQTPPIPSPHSVTFTLQQPSGTARDFPYSVMTLD